MNPWWNRSFLCRKEKPDAICCHKQKGIILPQVFDSAWTLPAYVTYIAPSYIIHTSSLLHGNNLTITIADVAVRKRHQRLAETLIIFTRAIQESGILFHEKTISNASIYNKRMSYETPAYYQVCKRMLCELDCIKCQGHIITEFSWKQVGWFPGCSAGKK